MSAALGGAVVIVRGVIVLVGCFGIGRENGSVNCRPVLLNYSAFESRCRYLFVGDCYAGELFYVAEDA